MCQEEVKMKTCVGGALVEGHGKNHRRRAGCRPWGGQPPFSFFSRRLGQALSRVRTNPVFTATRQQSRARIITVREQTVHTTRHNASGVEHSAACSAMDGGLGPVQLLNTTQSTCALYIFLRVAQAQRLRRKVVHVLAHPRKIVVPLVKISIVRQLVVFVGDVCGRLVEKNAFANPGKELISGSYGGKEGIRKNMMSIVSITFHLHTGEHARCPERIAPRNGVESRRRE